MPVTSLKARSARLLTGAAVPVVIGLGAVAPASACTTHSAPPAAHAARTTNHPAQAPSHSPNAAAIPAYSHIVVVIEENHSYSQIIGSSSEPYINSLARKGALFTDSHGITYPSQPNYLALFAGSTFGLTTDNCPYTFSAANLGSELRAAGLTYSSYSQSMPAQGYKGCHSGKYMRKHNPAPDFSNVPSADNKTFAQFPSRYASLPTVSLVDPNLLDDMHNGTVAQGDTWLNAHFNGYVKWAMNNNSLLILTWDTDNRTSGNHVATLFAGAHVTPGRYGESITHYNVLRTIEQAYGLPYAGASSTAAPI